jgi:hypothetical protein
LLKIVFTKKYLLFWPFIIIFIYFIFPLQHEESCKLILEQGIVTRLSNVISKHPSDKAKVSFPIFLFYFLFFNFFFKLLKKSGMMLLFCLSLFSKKLEKEFSTEISIIILSEILKVFSPFIVYVYHYIIILKNYLFFITYLLLIISIYS